MQEIALTLSTHKAKGDAQLTLQETHPLHCVGLQLQPDAARTSVEAGPESHWAAQCVQKPVQERPGCPPPSSRPPAAW